MTLKFSFERLQSHKNGCQLEACSMHLDLRQKMPDHQTWCTSCEHVKLEYWVFPTTFQVARQCGHGP